MRREDQKAHRASERRCAPEPDEQPGSEERRIRRGPCAVATKWTGTLKRKKAPRAKGT